MSKFFTSPKNRTRTLCNYAPGATIIFTNADLTVDEAGWTKIPYGLWRHSMGWQQFGKEEAIAICNAFTSIMGRIKRAIVGLPVFKGHPDEPGMAAEFPDKHEYGQVSEMKAMDDGLAIRQVLSNAGADLVRSGLKFISPRWDAKPIGEKDDATVWSPYKMLSIGLVKRPNIPNASLVNHSSTPDIMNKKDLIELFKLAADATDEQVRDAVAAASQRPSAESLSNAEGKLAGKDTEIVALKSSVTALTTERDTANTALANERKSHRTSLINAAVKDGRVKPADLDLWKGRLETNFAAESVTLSNLAPVIKTTATTEQAALALLNQRLSGMSEEERRSFLASGTLSNDDGDGPSSDMANVKELCNMVNKEMKSGNYDHIKDPNQKYSAAMGNVLKLHKKFLQTKDDETAA